MNRTKIPWADFTWNIITGCLGPHGTPSLPGRCPYCYARKLAKGRLKKLYLSNTNIVHNSDPTDPFTPRFWPSRLIEPFKLKKPSRIFVCSMGELFSHAYPPHWLSCILYTIYKNSRHTFILLTKKPTASLNFILPDNVWLGVTVNVYMDSHNLRILQDCHVKTRFVSFEPLLGDVLKAPDVDFSRIDWIIIGAQTQPTLLPKPDWVYRIIDRARHEGIPLFLKPNLHWPERIQEFPPKVAEISHTSLGIPSKNGASSQGKRIPRGSLNAKKLSPGQGQHLDKLGAAK